MFYSTATCTIPPYVEIEGHVREAGSVVGVDEFSQAFSGLELLFSFSFFCFENILYTVYLSYIISQFHLRL